MVHQFDERRLTYVRCLQQHQQQQQQQNTHQLLTAGPRQYITATTPDYVMYTGNTARSLDISGAAGQSPTGSMCPRGGSGGSQGSYVTNDVTAPHHQSASVQQRRQISYYHRPNYHQHQLQRSEQATGGCPVTASCWDSYSSSIGDAQALCCEASSTDWPCRTQTSCGGGNDGNCMRGTDDPLDLMLTPPQLQQLQQNPTAIGNSQLITP